MDQWDDTNAMAQWLKDVRVLLLESDSEFSTHITRELRAIGCVCRSTSSYTAAFDLLKLDQQIKVMVVSSGASASDFPDVELATLVEASMLRRPDIVIIGSGSPYCRTDFQSIAVDRFLEKPWGVDDLIEIVGNYDPADVRDSDTVIAKAECETTLARFGVGQKVRISAGPLEGCIGVVAGPRAGGRILLQIQDGVYVEVDQCAIERAN